MVSITPEWIDYAVEKINLLIRDKVFSFNVIVSVYLLYYHYQTNISKLISVGFLILFLLTSAIYILYHMGYSYAKRLLEGKDLSKITLFEAIKPLLTDKLFMSIAVGSIFISTIQFLALLFVNNVYANILLYVYFLLAVFYAGIQWFYRDTMDEVKDLYNSDSIYNLFDLVRKKSKGSLSSRISGSDTGQTKKR